VISSKIPPPTGEGNLAKLWWRGAKIGRGSVLRSIGSITATQAAAAAICLPPSSTLRGFPSPVGGGISEVRA
jgi:hypothetical protein